MRRVLLRRVAIGAGIVWAAAVLLFVWAMLFYDGRQDIDLADWAEGDGFSADLMPGARWATDELCGSDVPCIQAVTSETLTMYRFEYRELAQAAAAYWGEDAYLTGWIVVRFEPGALSAQDRDAFEGSVGCINTWVSEDGRDC
jgi:hypothetical protein